MASASASNTAPASTPAGADSPSTLTLATSATSGWTDRTATAAEVDRRPRLEAKSAYASAVATSPRYASIATADQDNAAATPLPLAATSTTPASNSARLVDRSPLPARACSNPAAAAAYTAYAA